MRRHQRTKPNARRGAALCSLALLWAASSGATPPEGKAEGKAPTSPPAAGQATPSNKAQGSDKPAPKPTQAATPQAPGARGPGAQHTRAPGQSGAAPPKVHPPGAAVGLSPSTPAPSAGAPGPAASGVADQPLVKNPHAAIAGLEARGEAIAAYRAALRAEREARAKGEQGKGAATRGLEKARAALLKAHRVARAARSPLSEARLKARDQKLAELLEKARGDRDKRRQERVAELKKTYGTELGSPAVRNELIVHAWRVARLNRLSQMAEAEERTELVTWAQELLDKETARHQAKLAKLTKEEKGASPKSKEPTEPGTGKPEAKAPNAKTAPDTKPGHGTQPAETGQLAAPQSQPAKEGAK